MKIARLYKRNVSGRVTLPPGTVLKLVSFNKRRQNEEAFLQKHSWRSHVSPMFLSFAYRKHCFQCRFLFSRCKLCLRYTAGNFTETPSMRVLAKVFRTRASEQFEQRRNFASTFKLDGPFNTLIFCTF